MDFDVFVSSILGKPVAHAWRGHGGTIFLELGVLKPGRTRRDGTTGNAIGEFSIHLEPNWRFEGVRSILCGSDDPHRAIERLLSGVIGSNVESIHHFGRLPELEVVLPSGAFRTFSSGKGQPNWTINRWARPLAMYCQLGKVKFDGGAPNNSFKPNLLRKSA
ncbi:hypothetical protein ACQKD0_09275 [Vreelandella aquamarina]|uniref:hypothetical protein n=1 Tax=Vreelandella aquamarina TaxID=77097 RepID=UPI003D091F19